jgi:ceramide glucosyltransferase
MLRWLLVAAIGVSLGYSVVTLVGAARWVRRRRPRGDDFTPPVTLLKPVKGPDAELLENLRSFFRQDYPEYQILFGAADPEDPAVPVVRRVLTEHPEADAQLVLCPESLGPNAKVSTLHQMVPFARHDVLVVSDSDTRVPSDYLRQVAAPLAHPRVGVVTALYRGAAPTGLAANLERLLIDTQFIPRVLAASVVEGVRFTLGATVALRRKVLDELGGFAPFARVLAEDYQFGYQAVAGGHTVALASVVVDCVLGRVPFRDFFLRQVRWERTTRACRAGGYFGSVLRHGVFFALLLLLLQGPSAWTVGLLAAISGLRLSVALAVSAGVLRALDTVRSLWLLPLSDALSVLLWVLAFTGNTVTWRGQRYRLRRGGYLVPLDAK